MRWALIVPLGACSYGILSTFAKLAYAEGFTPAEVIGAEMPVTDAHPVKRSAVMLTGALLLVCIVFPPGFLRQGALAAGRSFWPASSGRSWAIISGAGPPIPSHPLET